MKWSLWKRLGPAAVLVCGLAVCGCDRSDDAGAVEADIADDVLVDDEVDGALE